MCLILEDYILSNTFFIRVKLFNIKNGKYLSASIGLRLLGMYIYGVYI